MKSSQSYSRKRLPISVTSSPTRKSSGEKYSFTSWGETSRTQMGNGSESGNRDREKFNASGLIYRYCPFIMLKLNLIVVYGGPNLKKWKINTYINRKISKGINDLLQQIQLILNLFLYYFFLCYLLFCSFMCFWNISISFFFKQQRHQTSDKMQNKNTLSKLNIKIAPLFLTLFYIISFILTFDIFICLWLQNEIKLHFSSVPLSKQRLKCN